MHYLSMSLSTFEQALPIGERDSLLLWIMKCEIRLSLNEL